jgi:hypothetical protein
MKFSLRSFLQSSVNFLPLAPKHSNLPQHPIFFTSRDLFSQAYITTGKIILLHILVFVSREQKGR